MARKHDDDATRAPLVSVPGVPAQGTPAPSGPDAGPDAGAEQVQAAFDEAAEKGYFGETPDPTPNENYTVAGVTRGAPTPETVERPGNANLRNPPLKESE